MGNGTTYLGVLGLLVGLTAALGGNASDLAHRAEARLRLAKRVSHAGRFARQQAAFTASNRAASKKLRDPLVEGQRPVSGAPQFFQEPYGGRKLRTAKSPELPAAPTPVPPAAHRAAVVNPRQ